MELTEAISLTVGIIGIIGTCIAIYQWAVINEGKKRKNELQFLLAGINSLAVQKQLAWQNQISLLSKPSSPEEWEIARLHVRAKDEAAEIAGLTVALEGAIDTDNSAIAAMMDRYTDITEKNNKLQTEGMKNPSLNPNSSANE